MTALRRDWTRSKRGRTNSSKRYLEMVNAVAELIRMSGPDIVNGRADTAARLIVSQLAHVHGLAPKETP